MAGLSFDDLDSTAPLSEDEATAALNTAASVVAGHPVQVQVTSTYRTPQHNADIGGAKNSLHTRGDGQAQDWVAPSGVDPNAVRSELQEEGYPVSEWLNEKAGDRHSTGPHMHWGWGPKGSQTAAPAAPAAGPVNFSDLDGGAAAPAGAPAKGPVSFDDLEPDPSWGDVIGAQFRTTFDRWKAMAGGVVQAIAAGVPTETSIPNVNPLGQGIAAVPESLTPAQKAQTSKDVAATTAWGKKVYADAQQHIAQTVPQMSPGSVKDYAAKITAGVIDLVPVVAAGMATDNPIIPATLMGGSAAAQTYGAARAAGRTHQQASMDATFTGMVNGALGTLPIGILMKPGQTFLGKVLQSAGSFGAFSVATEALQIGYDKGLVTPDMTLAQAWQRLKDAGITGTLTGALLGAGHGGLEVAVARYAHTGPQKPVQQQVEPTAPTPAPKAQAPVAPRPAAKRADLLAKAAIPEPGREPAASRTESPVTPVTPEPFFKPEDLEQPTFKTTPAQIAQEHALEAEQLASSATKAAAEKHTPEVLKPGYTSEAAAEEPATAKKTKKPVPTEEPPPPPPEHPYVVRDREVKAKFGLSDDVDTEDRAALVKHNNDAIDAMGKTTDPEELDILNRTAGWAGAHVESMDHQAQMERAQPIADLTLPKLKGTKGGAGRTPIGNLSILFDPQTGKYGVGMGHDFSGFSGGGGPVSGRERLAFDFESPQAALDYAKDRLAKTADSALNNGGSSMSSRARQEAEVLKNWAEKLTLPEPPAPAQGPAQGDLFKPVGQNTGGHQLYEDKNGARSYLDGNVRVTEPVQMRPTRAGVQMVVDHTAHPEFATIDEAPQVPAPSLPEPVQPPAPPEHQKAILLSEAVREHFRQSAGPLTAKMLQRMAEEIYGGTLADGTVPRDEMYDAAELGLNLRLRQGAGSAGHGPFSPVVDVANAIARADQIGALKDRLPTQTVRAGEKETHQQFSTPPDYSYAATWAADLHPSDVVLEPSAGTGSFVTDALNAGVREVHANDLSDRRADMLRSLNPTNVTSEDAEHINAILPESVKPTVVLMNPPFSQTAGRMGTKMVLGTDAKHVEEALGRLQPGGRLVAILGGGTTFNKPFWKRIHANFDIRANIGVEGKIYRKYGTTFPTRLVVIDKTPPSGRPIVELNGITDAAGIIRALEKVRGDRIHAAGEPATVEPVGQGLAGQGQSAIEPVAPVPDTTGILGPRKGRQASGQAGGAKRPGRAGELALGGEGERGQGAGAGAPVADHEPGRSLAEGAVGNAGTPAAPGEQPTDSGGGGAGDGIRPDGSGQRDDPGVTEAPAVVRATEASLNSPTSDAQITDAVYEPYTPQRVKVEGAPAHPGPLVQSAAMASVLPPAPRHALSIPARLIRNGVLSDAQLEAVVYAGHAHAERIPQVAAPGDARYIPERRRGFFIGDGTGVGKGREVSGIILDNWARGAKKHIWVSEKKPLINDARRDWSGVGQDPKDVIEHGATKPGDAIKQKQGILFTTYDTLKAAEQVKAEGQNEAGEKIIEKTRGKTRVQQIIDWVGPDFDGVIAFDEAHNLGNSFDQKANRGVKKAAAKALAGVELQNALPNARVLYVSATGATEVSNLAYADRLGLWGRGTAFADRNDFLAKVSKGGVAAMELVARDMKALGRYIARNLSYDGVEYDRVEHTLSPEQRLTYDKLAEAWQLVLKNFHAAMEAVGITEGKEDGGSKTKNAAAKSAILSQFWGGHQRFFNQVITSMQMPTVLRNVERDLAEGRQAVLQLVNTNEAAQERALTKIRAEGEPDALEDLDMSPRDQIMQLVTNAFPTQRFEAYTDENGNERSRPVVDAKGNPVRDPALIRAREALLDQLGAVRVPDGPLEMLLNHFGPEKVAEVTGRKQRVIRVPDQKTGQMRTIVDKRPGSSNVAEANLFQEGKKPVLVFSEAGGTGRSYHADINAGSAGARRSHYLVQAGWRADKAVQGFGRTHRTNQASAPIFHLVTTDLQGQKRFVSSIARRLGQLGALTKGERRTGNQGMFGLRDNLESDEARDALKIFYSDVAAGKIEGVGPSEFADQMGLQLMDPTSGRMLEELPPMTKFLNRLLSLKFDMQNAVFNEFSRRMDDVIDRAAAAGTLDTGVETYKADKITKVGDQVVYTDPDSGAETHHVHLVTSTRNKPASFEDVKARLERANPTKDTPFVRSVRSGKVVGVAEATPYTDKDGRIIEQKRLIGPLDYEFLDAYKLNDTRYWQPVKDEEAEGKWGDQIKKIPEFSQEDLHLITGAVLPIWDRLAGSPKIFRLQTDAGERMLGRVIPSDSVNETLEKLGANKLKITAKPDEIARGILDEGKRAKLANGWTIKRSLVAGEPRMELIGPDLNYVSQLKQDGVFTERIDWKTRFFIPSGDKAATTLGRVIADRPLTQFGKPTVGEEEGGSQFQRMALARDTSKFQRAFHGSPYDFDKFENRALGTGEGAQAFGHGHYFSGARAVADYYRQTVSQQRADTYEAIRRAGVDVPKGGDLAKGIYAEAARTEGGKQIEPERAARYIQYRNIEARSIDAAKLAQAVTNLREGLKGKLYTVRLAPKDDEWLDWNKPLSKQSEKVRAALTKMRTKGLLPERVPANLGREVNGMDLYRHLMNTLAPAEKSDWTHAYTGYEGSPRASEELRKAGIPGIRYADANSRLAVAKAETRLSEIEGEPDKNHDEIERLKKEIAENTHNYVVFDPEHITIESKEQRASLAGRVGQAPGTVRLAKDVVAELPHAPTPEEQSVIDQVGRIARQMVPKAEVVAARRLFTHGANDQRLDAISGATTRGARRLIAWSLEAPDAVGTLRHEAVHWLKRFGFLQPAEWGTLEKAAQTGDWIGKHRIHERYPDLDAEGKIEEAVAEQMSLWRRAPRAVPAVARPIFEKVAMLLGRVRDYLRQAFGHDVSADTVFSRIASGEVGSRTPVTGAIRDASQFQKMDPEERDSRIVEGARSIISVVEDFQMAIAPMARGSDMTRATVKDFANLMRMSRDYGRFQMERLKKDFSPVQLKRMWEAADEKSIALQQGNRLGRDPLDRLSPEERAAVNEQQRDAESVWNSMREAGQIEGEGIPSYVPHLYVEVGEAGYRRLGSNRSVRSIPGLGRNVTTTSSHLLHRKYLTAEEGAEAASKKFGVETAVLKDIRTLPLATMRNRAALAGFQLIKTIKEMGKSVGEDWVAEGAAPPGFFHIDNPSFYRWRPAFVTDEASGKVVPAKDQNGNMLWQKVPLSIREDWEGPLRSALTEPDGPVYRAFMDLKMRAMNNIMFSPLVQLHLLTELGRSFPVQPWKVATLKILFEGNRAKNDPATRMRAVMAGMVPIGHQGAMQDISSTMETDNLVPGRSWTAKILGAVPGWLDPRAGVAVKRAIDRVGDLLHNTLLWDRVQDLQFGLFTTLSDYARAKGFSPETADRFAAHEANRYAGTLPVEAMSPLARKISNIMLFSRTYTLGNLGVLKDAMGGLLGAPLNLVGRAVGRPDVGKGWGGLPTDVQAQIKRDAPEELNRVQSLTKRKTLAILAVDVALVYAVNAIATNLFAYYSGRESGDEILKGYAERMQALGEEARANPLAILNPIHDLDRLSPTWGNEIDPNTGEPLRRIFVGYDKEGTAIYARNPTGKFGEEYTNWLSSPQSFLNTLKVKLNALAVKPTLDVLANDKGFGRHIYNAGDGAMSTMAKIAAHYVEATLPMDQINAARDMLMGKTKELDAARMLGRAGGVTFRRGAPGGPAVGLMYQLEDAHRAKVNEALPQIRQKIIDGHLEDARRDMNALGIPIKLQLYYIRTARNPKLRLSPHAMREISRYATPDEMAHLRQLRGATQ